MIDLRTSVARPVKLRQCAAQRLHLDLCDRALRSSSPRLAPSGNCLILTAYSTTGPALQRKTGRRPVRGFLPHPRRCMGQPLVEANFLFTEISPVIQFAEIEKPEINRFFQLVGHFPVRKTLEIWVCLSSTSFTVASYHPGSAIALQMASNFVQAFLSPSCIGGAPVQPRELPSWR